MDAALYGHYDVAKLLIDSGADVNVNNANNETSLSMAEDKGYPTIVNLLRQAGAK